MEIRMLRGHEIKQMIEKQDFSLWAKSWTAQQVLSLSHQGRLIVIGAFLKELSGIIVLDDFHDISILYVKEEWRHQGIGTQLIRFVQKMSMEDLVSDIPLMLCSFFEKLGFQRARQKSADIMTMIYRQNDANVFCHYQQVHDFISAQKSRVYALDNFRRFMFDMGNPQQLLKTIHIGGTNGKGSTTNYVRNVLQLGGYKVASFTSPALMTRLEVMRINDVPILEKEIVRYANHYMKLWLDYELSMFEIEVFIAIMYFLKQQVDFAIFEVGLGGELDATNIVYPIISVNTNIGLDHVEYLGDTYEKIARTKGGIIKDHVPFITGESKKECLMVFEELCQKHHSPLLQRDKIEHIALCENQVTYDYRGYHVVLKTSAQYQCQNSAMALEILLYLRENGYIDISDAVLLQGLKEAVWAGRFETVCQKPLMIIDGAHNKEGMEAFCESARHFSHIKVIFSALKDKDTHAMLELLLRLTDDVTVCEFDFYRAQSAQKLAENFPVHIEKNWHKAIDDAFLHQGVVFITGSLYFLSQVRPYIFKHQQ